MKFGFDSPISFWLERCLKNYGCMHVYSPDQGANNIRDKIWSSCEIGEVELSINFNNVCRTLISRCSLSSFEILRLIVLKTNNLDIKLLFHAPMEALQ